MEKNYILIKDDENSTNLNLDFDNFDLNSEVSDDNEKVSEKAQVKMI